MYDTRMKAFSMDLRERILDAALAGDSTQAEVAERYAVSLSFVEKLVKQWRTTQSIGFKVYTPGPKRVLAPYQDWIRQRIAAQPDVTYLELCTQLTEAKGPPASVSMMCREVKRLNLTLKKSRSTTINETRSVSRLSAGRSSSRWPTW